MRRCSGIGSHAWRPHKFKVPGLASSFNPRSQAGRACTQSGAALSGYKTVTDEVDRSLQRDKGPLTTTPMLSRYQLQRTPAAL